ncbi:MAG TPA: sensor histidine kinase [Vicinamibacterales bacterium]|nr:sensor histidine kinase [Vicinamibacterales bacterium]
MPASRTDPREKEPRPPSPSPRLVAGLVVTLAMILAFCLYTIGEIRHLRDEQTRIAERNRLGSLQLLRIQNSLSNLAAQMRDMADRTEPYPMVAWRQTFDRIRTDLAQAIAAERELAPAERAPEQQRHLEETLQRFWSTIDRAFAEAARGDEDQAAATLRNEATIQHQELASLISRFLVLNNTVEDEAARLNRAIYGRVIREILILMVGLLLLVGVTGIYGIIANRRAFDDVQRLTKQLRGLSWRMMRMQEDLQESFSRELHDEFGQLLTAIGMLLARVKRNLAADSSLVKDLEEVQGIVQQTLERIRTESRLLHPVILDDFGLENALQWYVEQFGRQHGIETRFVRSGPIGVIPADAAIHIYRIVQEALTNVSRHAGSPEAWVRLRQDQDWIELEIEDRGRGLPAAGRDGPREGIGLISMRERAELMGGTFSLRPASPSGVIVSVRVPVRTLTTAAAVTEDREEASIG